MDVPTKIKSFGWRCFIDRLPTRRALSYRSILPFSNTSGVFCCLCEEIGGHMLLLCHSVNLVWRKIAEWIGFDNYKAEDIKESFMKWYKFGKKSKVRKGKEGVVWLAMIWYLWTARNEIVFRGDTWNISDIVWG